MAVAASTGACRFLGRELALPIEATQTVALEPDFTGLGYETSAVASGELRAERNAPLVELIRGLGPSGVLRIGGIVSDFAHYDATGTSRAQPTHTVFTHGDLESLAGLLNATGWRAIWSVNFAQGTIGEAIAQVRDLTQLFGNRLLAIELGNEVDQYGRGEPVFRRPPYRYEDYRAEYREWRTALLQAAPDVQIASPDVAADIDWVERAAAESANELRLLPAHYYRAPASAGSLEMLLEPDPRLLSIAQRLGAASRASGVPWRMCEANSFSGGGLQGASDTFAGALWTLDFMLFLASRGAAGVNLQTGVNQLGFLSWYSPIRSDRGVSIAGVPYYGMRAFAFASEGCDRVGEIAVGGEWLGVTAYVFAAGAAVRAIVLINRSTSDFDVSFDGPSLAGFEVARLIGPDAASIDGVTLAGASVGAEGRWNAVELEPLQDGRVSLPVMSAAVLRQG